MPAERAGYTVTMFLIDVSPSMGNLRTVELPDGPKGNVQTVEMTNLEYSLQFVLLKIQEMIFNGRKTDQCGVILFGTEDTDNIINERAGGYDHVTEYIPIGQPNANTLAKLQALSPSTVIGDPIDAMIVGIETQDKYLGNKKTWTRKMVLVTDGENPIEVEDWELTVKKMNSLNIITTVIGVDFDDEEFGSVQEDKSHIKTENEKFFHQFVGKLSNGLIGTAAYALQECVRPDVKVTKSALMGTVLRLGDFDTRPEEALELPVKMSKCTAVVRPPTMKKFAKRVDEEAKDRIDADDEDEEKKDVYAQLTMQTEYFVAKDTGAVEEKLNVNEKRELDEDEEDIEIKSEEAGDETDEKVDKEQLIRGFKYGASYAPCPDGQFTRLETRRGMDICGFFPDANLRRDLTMGEVQYVWADPSSGKSQVAFSSVVQAMLSRGVVAIARWVSRDGMDPKMGVLVPRAFDAVDCFLWLQMPFADDVRRYTFPSLEHLVSKKGEEIIRHPFLPTKEQMDVMDRFVDAMDLMQAGDKDENGARMPWFDPRLSYNPSVHRIRQALFHAAIVTDLRSNPLPPPHPEVIKYLEPPRRVLKRAHDTIEECKNTFKIKQVPKKITRARKDGHVRADDDDDELLLLEQPSTSTNPRSASHLQSQQAQEPAPSATLVDSQNGNGRPLFKGKEDVMDVDSETEPESDDGTTQTSPALVGKKKAYLPTPQPSLVESSQQSFSQSQGLDLDDGREPGRIIGSTHPLVDFRKNIKEGDLVTKAVEDLAFVIKDVLLKPFASRRHKEMTECMREMRSTCLNEDEIDAWNEFLRDLKESCVSPSRVASAKGSWEVIQSCGSELGLITEREANALGGKSNVSEIEAKEFMAS